MGRSDRRRRGERGATLSLVAITVSLMLIAFGSAYLMSAQHVFRMAVLRERKARATAAAEAGLALGMRRLAAAAAGVPGAADPLRGEETLPGALASWEVVPEGSDRARVRATGATGEGSDRIAVSFVADVERREGRKLHVVRVARD